MATSGSVDFNLDMAEITEEAFERCGLELLIGRIGGLTYGQLSRFPKRWLNCLLLPPLLLTL